MTQQNKLVKIVEEDDIIKRIYWSYPYLMFPDMVIFRSVFFIFINVIYFINGRRLQPFMKICLLSLKYVYLG